MMKTYSQRQNPFYEIFRKCSNCQWDTTGSKTGQIKNKMADANHFKFSKNAYNSLIYQDISTKFGMAIE